MTNIPDFTEEEIRIVQDSVNERYGHEIELQLADAEIRPDLSIRELIEVPAIFWAERDANFIIIKMEKTNTGRNFSTVATSNLALAIRSSMTLVIVSSPLYKCRPITKPKKRNRPDRILYLTILTSSRKHRTHAKESQDQKESY